MRGRTLPGSSRGGDLGDPSGCRNCGSRHRVRDEQSGETHCADCGLVLEQPLSADDIGFSEPTRENRGGRGVGPFQAPGSVRRGLGSTLQLNRDGRGNPLPSSHRSHFFHLKWIMNREVTRKSEPLTERSPARELLASTASELGLPAVVLAEAERLFRDGSARGAFRGRALGSIVGACLYGACRRYGLPRTLGEIAKVLGNRRSEIGRAFKALGRTTEIALPSVALSAYLQRYAQELALSPQVRSTVEDMIRMAEGNPEISGLSPHGVVAALIYLASEREGEPRSRSQVARVGAVTEVTLRSTARILSRVIQTRDVGREG
jgi:transcription initiation factor TFIIB